MRRFSHQEDSFDRLPQPAAPVAPPAAFLMCPLAAGMNPAQWMLYQLAFQQAQAVVRPSLPERDLLAVWN